MPYLHEQPENKGIQTSETAEYRLCQQIMTSYYDPLTIHKLTGSGAQMLFHQDIRDLEGIDAVNTLSQLSLESASNWYWENHSHEYLSRLNQLWSNAKPAVNADTAKTIIVIASMNETATSRAIDAFARSYGQNFETDVSVLVYHNFKHLPDRDIRLDINKCAQLSNVNVVEERVPEYNTLAMAKKEASDLALMKWGGKTEMMFVFTDADVEEVTEFTIQAGIDHLKNPRYIAATTENINNTEEIDSIYPVYAFIERLNYEVSLAARYSYAKPNLIGSCYFIKPKTLMSIGGLKPIFWQNGYLKPTTYEDMQLSDELRFIYLDSQYKKYPFADLARLNDHKTVRTDPSRDIQSLFGQQTAQVRWHNSETYKQVSGSKRISLQNLQRIQEITLLADPTEKNILAAINEFWIQLSNNIDHTVLRIGYSDLVTEALFRLGATEIALNIYAEYPPKSGNFILKPKSIPLSMEQRYIDRFTGIKFS